jgi:hypothetical protein
MRAYERLGKVQVREVLKAIADNKPLDFHGVTCSTASTRLLTYHIHGLNCCVKGCTISGQFFAVERAKNQLTASWHLNLYGIKNGEEVMMTSDHKLPRSKGGHDHISNRQPMCSPHNAGKGNQLIYL